MDRYRGGGEREREREREREKERERDRGEVSPGHTNTGLLCIRVHKYGFTVSKFTGVKIHACGHSCAYKYLCTNTCVYNYTSLCSWARGFDEV